MSDGIIRQRFVIPGNDFSAAGEASSATKKILSQLGVKPQAVKKTAVSMYEAEINAVIHAGGGIADIEIDQEKILVKITDEGPGIPDLEMAMKEGYSTAPDSVRELGFGAGMGLPNIKRYSDELKIHTEVGKGTTVEITIYIN